LAWTVSPLSAAVEINPKVKLTRGDVAPFIEMAAVPVWGTRPTRLAEKPFTGSGARFRPGDTLMARIIGCLENGKGAFIDFLVEPGFGSTEFIVFRAKPPLTPEAAFFLSRAEFVRAHAIAHMTGSSGRQRVPVDCFDHLLVALPPTREGWSREVSVLEELMQLSLVLWQENEMLTTTRNDLLGALFGGERRTRITHPAASAMTVGT
jgi:type I restriction enzyme S subunit